MSNKLQTIDPFELLGIDEKSTIKDARKAYYNLALLVHPDCGGNEESMKILVNAYHFVEKQLKEKNDITGDWEELGKNLEEDFKNFNLEVKAEIPKMTELYDLADMQQKEEAKKRNFGVYNDKFNEQFIVDGNDPFGKGYGNLMDMDHDYASDEEFIMPTKNKFTQEVQVYKEPHILPDTYGNNYRYDIKDVNDFSNYENKEYDYKKAHSELENEPKQIESKGDKPMNDISKALERLENERNQLEIGYTKIDLDIPYGKREKDD